MPPQTGLQQLASNRTRAGRPLGQGLLCALLALCGAGMPLNGDEVFHEAPLPTDDRQGYVEAIASRMPTKGRVKALVIFADFAGSTQTAPPDFFLSLFDPEYPGSLTHFYHTVSHGQLRLEAWVLPKTYIAPQAAAAYRAPNDRDVGGADRFALEILRQVDADWDLAAFDNNGPDGLADSGDDDGIVDYVFVCLPHVPSRFIKGPATGMASLGFEEYTSDDIAADGTSVRILGDRYHGTVLEARDYARAVGVMAHEFAHALGQGRPLPDLYDTSHLYNPKQGPAEYSAGIGKWGLMGMGTLGWQRDGKPDGPNPLSAWSLEQLGWISAHNDNLVSIKRDTTDLPLKDLHKDGAVYKVTLPPTIVSATKAYPQYLLLEYRQRQAHYYNARQPADGLLVWRVRYGNYRDRNLNNDEADKLVDVVCADGLYEDGGFGSGQHEARRIGFDNLDFWTKDEHRDYRARHGGNAGDATDLFDGERFTRLDGATNPSTFFEEPHPAAYTPPQIANITKRDGALRADIAPGRWAGTITESVMWAGDILVDGDLTVAPEGRLELFPGTRVRVATSDRLRAGRDPDRIEIVVQGRFLAIPYPTQTYDPLTGGYQSSRIRQDPVIFEAAIPGATWNGLFLPVELDSTKIVLRDTVTTDAVSPSLGAGVPTAVEEQRAPAVEFTLQPNYPNPFSDQTTLPYSLAHQTPVQFTIYNALGQPVRTLVDAVQPAGPHQVLWDGRDADGQPVARGVYLYRLVADAFEAKGKMLYMEGGFSQAAALDQALQRHGLADHIAISAASPGRYGLTRRQQSARQQAWHAGRHWVALRLQAGAAANTDALADRIGGLRQTLAGLDLAAATRRDLERALDYLPIIAPSHRADLLTGLHRTLAQTFHTRDAAVYFHLAEWLYSLGQALRVAQNAPTDAAALIDGPADAAAARRFAQALGPTAEDAPLLSALTALADQLTSYRTGAPPAILLIRVEQVHRAAER